MDNTTAPKRDLSIPAAIIIAGLIIAGAIVFIGNGGSFPALGNGGDALNPEDIKLEPVSAKEDHILGKPNAKIFIVEYSDYECPFCKVFNDTMKTVIEKYAEKGDVAWVYRHFPLDTIHPKADKESEAAECAAELGGEVKFWEFSDEIFRITPSNNGLDLKKLPEIARTIGLDVNKFNDCLNSGRHAEKVEKQFQSGIAAGVTGTPGSFLITPDGKTIPIPGAVPLENLESLIKENL